MKKIKIIRSRPLKEEEEVIDQQPQDITPEKSELTYESNPLEFMLMKYPSLRDTLVELLTEDFRDYISGIYVMAPKPTTFKIVLHNNQIFYLIYLGRTYQAKVSGKKYYLLRVSELEQATLAIADLLMLGTPPTAQGPETEITSTPEETPEETPAEEETPEELAEIKKKVGINLIREASTHLDSSTLKKPSPDKQSDRGQVLFNKIDAKNSLTTVDGDNIVINAKKSSEFIDALISKDYSLAARTPFYDTKGNTYRLSKLAKTADFGGGKGSGGGAEQTAVQESTQCLVNAIRYNKGSDITEKDLTDRNYTRAAKRIETTSSLDEMISFLNENPDWVTTTISTANALAKDFPGNFKFYRGKGVAADIDRAAKSALKTVVGAGAGMNINKWNPADIWMASSDLNISDIPSDKGIDKLNKWMRAKYKDKQLIGVSLKKCSNCGWKTYNLTSVKRTETFESVEPKDKDFFKTKDIYVNFTGGKIQFRNFSDISSWQGEIKSKEAAAGKIGGNIVSNILFSSGGSFLPDQANVLGICEDPRQPDIKRLYNKYKGISFIEGKEKMKENEFSKAFMKASLGNRTSNWMNISLLSTLSEMNEDQRDDFIQRIIGYSKSESNVSSVFIKVS